MQDDPKYVILFDGVCNLCNGTVQTIISNDKHKKFRFAPLQSATGERMLAAANLLDKGIDSIVFVENGKAYVRSTAALRIAWRMRGLYPLLAVFLIIPTPIRDWVYKWIARNRYKWFGKQDSCMVPTPDLTDRFLEMSPAS